MDLNSINANINRLLTNIWAVISFLKEFAVDGAKDVSITYINADGSESVKSFPNISKMWETFNITNNNGIVQSLNGDDLIIENALSLKLYNANNVSWKGNLELESSTYYTIVEADVNLPDDGYKYTIIAQASSTWKMGGSRAWIGLTLDDMQLNRNYSSTPNKGFVESGWFESDMTVDSHSVINNGIFTNVGGGSHKLRVLAHSCNDDWSTWRAGISFFVIRGVI